MRKYRPVLLAIFDGWGINESKQGNAILAANTPNLDNYFETYPHSKINASGEDVGLPIGQMGNSEVGHQNIGAGRIVWQNLVKISKAIREGDFFSNPALISAIHNCQKCNSALHLMGLVSDGGVHSHNTHIYGLLEMAKRNNLKKVYIHCFMDGRDTPPDSGKKYIEELINKTKEIGVGEIATISGRYYAMDRDKNYDRNFKAYQTLILGIGQEANSALEAMQKSYDKKIYDEFILPTIIKKENRPTATIQENDSVIFFNFRPDRAKQLAWILTDPQFDNFERPTFPKIHFVSMTQYAENLKTHVAFDPVDLSNTLGEVISKAGLTQLRIAETEKFAHVTRFFNGDTDDIFTNEDRQLIPSPKVATYDLQPEMSAPQVTKELLSLIDSDKYDVIILNYANCDMVGHTGFMDAAIKAVEAVDTGIGQIVPKILHKGGAALLTADHGNAEYMLDEKGGPFTAHTTGPVPMIFIAKEANQYSLKNGILADIAPTLLELLDIQKPQEMTGKSLLVKK